MKSNQKKHRPEQPRSPKRTQNEQDAEVAGFKVADLVQAPLRPPEPVKTEGQAATSNKKVKTLMLVGTALVGIGILLGFLVHVAMGVAITALGALAVVVAVFAPVR